MADQPKNSGNGKQSADLQKGSGEDIMVFISTIIIVLLFPMMIWGCFKTIQHYERAVHFRMGRLVPNNPRGPGMIIVNPFTDNHVEVYDINILTPAQFLVPFGTMALVLSLKGTDEVPFRL